MELVELMKDFEGFRCEVKEGCYLKWKLPLAMDISWNLLTLYIVPTDKGYIISDEGGLFKERMRGGEEYYFKKYCENEERCTYGIKVKDGYFYKEFPRNYNPQVAISDFIRFFVALDDFYCSC